MKRASAQQQFRSDWLEKNWPGYEISAQCSRRRVGADMKEGGDSTPEDLQKLRRDSATPGESHKTEEIR